jgi:hypothetical protein
MKDLLSAFHAQIGLDEYVHVLGRPGELRHRRAKPEVQLICGVCFGEPVTRKEKEIVT